jgi:hypothetical protein
MTEQEWLAGTGPLEMLAWLTGPEYEEGWSRSRQRPVSDRKLRLFAVACCRLCPDVRRDFADRYEAEGVPGRSDADWARGWCGDHIISVPKVTRAALLRDVVGNPFRPLTPATMSTPEALRWYEILEWDGGAVGNLARHIYAGRDWAALPILADALEDAGCEDEDVLMHCRGKGRCPDCLGKGGCCSLKDEPGVWGEMHRCALCAGSGWVDAGPHCRGCWVLDLILGRE